MAGSAVSIALTAAEYRRLSSLVRAGTTPQRLVRRARVVLGSASGLGSRALARREQRELARHGYELTVTGPWPPYSFVQEQD